MLKVYILLYFTNIMHIITKKSDCIVLEHDVMYTGKQLPNIRWKRLAYLFRAAQTFWIALNISFFRRRDPRRSMASSFLRFLDQKQRRTTIDRTPLDEWSARRRDLYVTTHNTHYGRTSISPAGSETTIYEPPQTDASDGVTAGTRLFWRGGSHLHETSVTICQFKWCHNTEEYNLFSTSVRTSDLPKTNRSLDRLHKSSH
jgi:hypothetical protein